MLCPPQEKDREEDKQCEYLENDAPIALGNLLEVLHLLVRHLRLVQPILHVVLYVGKLLSLLQYLCRCESGVGFQEGLG